MGDSSQQSNQGYVNSWQLPIQNAYNWYSDSLFSVLFLMCFLSIIWRFFSGF